MATYRCKVMRLALAIVLGLCASPVRAGSQYAFFKSMVGGTDNAIENYMRDYFELKPLAIRFEDRSDAEKATWRESYSKLLDYQDIDAILERNVSVVDLTEHQKEPLVYGFGGDLYMGMSKRQADGELWTEIPQMNLLAGNKRSLVPGVVQGGIKRGYSLIFNKMNMRHPPISEACRQMRSFFGIRCHANLYVTPEKPEGGENQGFEIHWDEMESFVVQIQGQKHWHVYQEAIHLPTPHQRFKPRADETGPVSVDITLQPGDVLYLPRGWVHDARTVDSDSLHLTIGVMAETVTYAHLLRALLVATQLAAEKSGSGTLLHKAAGKKPGAPQWGQVAHALIQAAANETVTLRETVPLSEEMLKAVQYHEPGYTVAARLREGLAVVEGMVEAGQALPRLLAYLTWAKPAANLGWPDKSVSQGLLDWGRQLAQGSKRNLKEVGSKLTKAFAEVSAFAATDGGLEEALAQLKAETREVNEGNSAKHALALAHHGHMPEAQRWAENKEELRHRHHHHHRRQLLRLPKDPSDMVDFDQLDGLAEPKEKEKEEEEEEEAEDYTGEEEEVDDEVEEEEDDDVVEEEGGSEEEEEGSEEEGGDEGEEEARRRRRALLRKSPKVKDPMLLVDVDDLEESSKDEKEEGDYSEAEEEDEEEEEEEEEEDDYQVEDPDPDPDEEEEEEEDELGEDDDDEEEAVPEPVAAEARRALHAHPEEAFLVLPSEDAEAEAEAEMDALEGDADGAEEAAEAEEVAGGSEERSAGVGEEEEEAEDGVGEEEHGPEVEELEEDEELLEEEEQGAEAEGEEFEEGEEGVEEEDAFEEEGNAMDIRRHQARHRRMLDFA